MATFDTIIRGGMIIDGLRSGRFVGDIGISDGKIAAIGGITGEAERILDARGPKVLQGIWASYSSSLSPWPVMQQRLFRAWPWLWLGPLGGRPQRGGHRSAPEPNMLWVLRLPSQIISV